MTLGGICTFDQSKSPQAVTAELLIGTRDSRERELKVMGRPREVAGMVEKVRHLLLTIAVMLQEGREKKEGGKE